MNLLSTQRAIAMVVLALALLVDTGCSRSQGGSTTAVSAGGIPSEELTETVPLGQVAGAPAGTTTALSTANPYEADPQAIQQGKQLYVRMNCAGCHAYKGNGNMGPDLTDSEWRYGGLPIQIYKTIRDGRPQGMPAWGAALPPQDIWKLVAYIQSLGGTVSVKDYEHARQGDQPGEQVAPEAQADAQQSTFSIGSTPASPSEPGIVPDGRAPTSSDTLPPNPVDHRRKSQAPPKAGQSKP